MSSRRALSGLVPARCFVVTLDMNGKIVSLNVSDKKGVRKKPVNEVSLKTEFGVEGDAHASSEWHRQVSLLAVESIGKMREKGLDVKPGDFAENITTEGIDLLSLSVGTQLTIGNGIKVEVTQIGKECHTRCAIYYQAGDCVMPKEGIFVRVLSGGVVRKGDQIAVTPWDVE
jgi:MOSC domain-containing protein YiiM